MGVIRTRQESGVGVITLNNPALRNAITADLVDELTAAVNSLVAASSVHALVLTGAGSTFCAGADRNLLARADEATLRFIYDAFLQIRQCPLPTVAAVNGPAVGAGLNLALACDIRVAAQSAVFDPRFIQIPIHPGGGCTWMLRELAGPQAAAALTLFGLPIDAVRATELGLAWACIPDDELLATALWLCSTVTAAPRALVQQVKATLGAIARVSGHSEAVEYELRQQLSSIAHTEFRDQFKAHQ
ncbi:MAG TPA: enoyl-CoA hydratase-related protein [Mycobacterium sp.]|jgi:enoyl-CoA hydratase|nr:enoyl-CoA hydratase-related protein [Mycobacterium sp.]